MESQRRTRISKFLSYHLRHHPEELGLTLEPGGWVSLDLLLKNARASGFALEASEVEEVVGSSDKQRFSLDAPNKMIRANQGHSTEVDLQLAESVPPKELFHGTPQKFVDSILRDGLQKQQRHHVHLSPDRKTAEQVGARRGQPRLLRIAAGAMQLAGHRFFVSQNGVWLVDSVPPEFLTLEPSSC